MCGRDVRDGLTLQLDSFCPTEIHGSGCPNGQCGARAQMIIHSTGESISHFKKDCILFFFPSPDSSFDIYGAEFSLTFPGMCK